MQKIKKTSLHLFESMVREEAAQFVALGTVTYSFLESVSPPWKMNKTKDVPIYSTSGKLGGDGLVVSV